MTSFEEADPGPLPEGSGPSQSEILHGSCVAYRERAVLILGASGAGKSSLALQLMGLGASLIADDRTRLRRDGERVLAEAPDSIRGMIEARGVGILNAPALSELPLHLVVDLDEAEVERLPQHHQLTILGKALPLLYAVPHPHFPSAILHYLAYGRKD